MLRLCVSRLAHPASQQLWIVKASKIARALTLGEGDATHFELRMFTIEAVREAGAQLLGTNSASRSGFKDPIF